MNYLYQIKIPHHYPNHYIVLKTRNLTPTQYITRYSDNMGHYNNGYSICADERVIWAHNGKQISETQKFCKLHKLSDEDTFFFTLTYGHTLPEKREEVHPNHDTISIMQIHAVIQKN